MKLTKKQRAASDRRDLVLTTLIPEARKRAAAALDAANGSCESQQEWYAAYTEYYNLLAEGGFNPEENEFNN